MQHRDLRVDFVLNYVSDLFPTPEQGQLRPEACRLKDGEIIGRSRARRFSLGSPRPAMLVIRLSIGKGYRKVPGRSIIENESMEGEKALLHRSGNSIS
jgi:hypothetical protein